MTVEDFRRWYGPPDPVVLTGRVSGDTVRLNLEGGDDSSRKDVAKHFQPGNCQLTAIPKQTKDGTGELAAPLTWAIITQCARLAEQYSFTWRPDKGLNEWIREEFERRFTEYASPDDLKFNISSLDREPMTHQASGAFVGALNKRFFFGDDMGTGKTMTALLTLAELEARGEDPWPAFVVTPASVVDPWLEELETVFPDWTFTDYRGTKRRNLSTRYQVYVMSWDTFRKDMFNQQMAECPQCHVQIEWTKALAKKFDAWFLNPKDSEPPEMCPEHKQPYQPIDMDKVKLPPLLEFLVPRTIILDEAHALCNVKTKQSQAARKIARIVPYAFPMSGTPISNNVAGFWSALNVLDIRSFPDQERYKMRYTDRYKKDYGPEEIEGLTTVNRQEFYTLMQGSMRRVAKADVLTELPPKRYSVRYVEIPPAFRRAYDEMEEDMIAHIPDTDEPLPVMNTLAQLQRLSQLASSSCDVKIEYRLDENPKSLTFGEEVPHYNVTMKEPSWKVDELLEILEEMGGQPLVCFAPHTQLIELAGRRAESKGYRVGYIKGGQSHARRKKIRLGFQDGQYDLLCANTQAGGVGLTLTRASTVVFLERPWSFVQSAQAEDRIHRRGQLEEAHIIDIIAVNTVEDRVRKALRDKAQQLADLVRDPRIVKEILGGL